MTPTLETVRSKHNTGQLAITGRLLLQHSLLNLVGQVIPLLAGVATVPLIVRGLGPERFGLLSIAWVVLSYSAVFDLGLGRASTKFVAEALARGERERVSAIVAAAVTAQGILGVAGGLIFVLAAPVLVSAWLKVPAPLMEEATEAFRLLGLAVPLVMVSGSLSGALQGAQRFDLVNAVQVPATVGVYLAALTGALLGLGLVAVMALIVLLRAVAVVGLLLTYTRYLAGFQSFPASMFRTLFSFGGWVSVSNLIIPITVYSDRFLIATFGDMSAAGHYVASYELANRILLLVPAAVSIALFPELTNKLSADDLHAFLTLSKRSWKYLLIALVPMGITCSVFASEILAVAFGGQYVMDAPVFRILTVAAVLNGLAYVPFTAAMAAGRPDVIAKYHIIELPFYMVVAILLVQRFGITGAGLAWCLRMVWTIIIFTYLCTKVAGLTIRTFLNGQSLLAVGVLVVLGASSFLSDGFGVALKGLVSLFAIVLYGAVAGGLGVVRRIMKGPGEFS
jgi:O-antigen/teichoic acid export membrane protein